MMRHLDLPAAGLMPACRIGVACQTMNILMTRPWARRALPLTVASVLALSLVPMFPASPAAAGERGERCQQAARELQPIKDTVKTMVNLVSMRIDVPPDFRRARNEEILRSVRDLEQTLKASANQEVLWRIRVLSERTVQEGYARALLNALDDRVRELSANISDRREFDVTFVDGTGQTVTKKVAC